MVKPRVQVVDDNEMFLEMAEFALTQAGFEVETALDAVTAISKIATFLPGLILMDVQMPVIDGIELTKRL